MSIKFRVWDKAEREFGDISDYVASSSWFGRFDPIPMHESLVLQQFTGLIDKNGKSIYEGDILKFRFYEYDSFENILIPHQATSYVLEREKPYQKLYMSQTFGTELDLVSESPLYGDLALDLIEVETCEVIGNIYENPELLVKH